MKRILAALVIAVFSLSAFAQDFPAGIPNEICEVEQDDHTYSIFSLKDEDGFVGYYLNVGRVFNLLEISKGNDTSFSLDHVDQTFLLMGTNAEEALDYLESLLELVDEDTGVSRQFPCRTVAGFNKLSGINMATCIVTKRFLQSKRLCFVFSNGHRTAEADLTRSAIKSLRWSFKLSEKIHSDN